MPITFEGNLADVNDQELVRLALVLSEECKSKNKRHSQQAKDLLIRVTHELLDRDYFLPF